MSITMPPAEPYSVPGISSAGATTIYYEPDPITGCGVTRITRFPGSTSRPPTRRRSASAPATTAVVQQHHLIGPTRPIHVGLIKSANDPTPVSQSGSLSMYYHPMLNEWRPFPTDIEVSEEVRGRQRRIRRIGGRLIHKAKDLGRDRASWPIRKEDISLPVPGSKRSAFEPIAEALQSLL